MRSVLCAWIVQSEEFGGPFPPSPHAPLWRNPNLSQFFASEDPVVWTKFGIKKLGNVSTNGQLKTFDKLKSLYHLPHTHFFCYIQLRRACQKQFKHVCAPFSEFAIESMLRDDDLQKPLSNIYKFLFPETNRLLTVCRFKWELVVPDLDTVDWEDVWDAPFTRLISAHDQLIHYKFLHRVYLTPAKIAQIFNSVTSACWQCSASGANFMHIFWDCPGIQNYWGAVFLCVQEVTIISLNPSVKYCLLGLVDDLAPTTAIRTLLTLLFFHARKHLVLSWTSTTPPSVESWKASVNKTVPFYKATYLNRGGAS